MDSDVRECCFCGHVAPESEMVLAPFHPVPISCFAAKSWMCKDRYACADRYALRIVGRATGQSR